mmetsp:Transcript_2830/g.10264  ORF Transcript_2830/g.10264 Transcript_2830/m.10264 type:complete len:218 (+) Transcript_2830:2901-3554(+)
MYNTTAICMCSSGDERAREGAFSVVRQSRSALEVLLDLGGVRAERLLEPLVVHDVSIVDGVHVLLLVPLPAALELALCLVALLELGHHAVDVFLRDRHALPVLEAVPTAVKLRILCLHALVLLHVNWYLFGALIVCSRERRGVVHLPPDGRRLLLILAVVLRLRLLHRLDQVTLVFGDAVRLGRLLPVLLRLIAAFALLLRGNLLRVVLTLLLRHHR